MRDVRQNVGRDRKGDYKLCQCRTKLNTGRWGDGFAAGKRE
jgi:hypothetical protein